MEPIKQVELEKSYDAPPERIWQAWTDPEMLKQWWGPNDVIIPECQVDLRVGGRFQIVMEAGEGMGQYKGIKWPMEAHYAEVVPNSKLVYEAKAWTEGHEEETQIDQVTELNLMEEGGKTKLKIKAVINKAGPGAQMAAEGMQYGFSQQLDKLEEFLKNKS